MQLVGGWYDIFLPWMLEDFAALQAAGRDAQLVIGPWTHTAPGLLAAAASAKGSRGCAPGCWATTGWCDPATVRVLVTGERSRRRLARAAELAAAGNRRAAAVAGRPAGACRRPSRRTRRRPATATATTPPTPRPSLGGPVLLAREPVVDNRPLEARADVLTYTTAPLPATVEAIGPVRVELWVRASSPYFDMFARVCDVDRDGASWNVCDALARVAPGRFEQTADGSWRVAFDLWPMGHRFAAGHRIRLQVSSGAHPRYARNPGTGEDLATATRLQAVDIELLHGAPHPSVLVLPCGAD